jgi:hypothetical protein
MEPPTGIFIITNVSHKLNLVLGKVSDKRGPVVARADPYTEFAKVGFSFNNRCLTDSFFGV